MAVQRRLRPLAQNDDTGAAIWLGWSAGTEPIQAIATDFAGRPVPVSLRLRGIGRLPITANADQPMMELLFLVGSSTLLARVLRTARMPLENLLG
jgi:hypothetical protein